MDKIKFSEWLDLREVKDACYHKVKSRYKVWPSAYACVPIETSKALTKEGWKSYSQLSVGEEILTLNLNSKELEYKPIKNLYSYENSSTLIIKNKKSNFNFECTSNHKWVVQKNEKMILVETNELKSYIEEKLIVNYKNSYTEEDFFIKENISDLLIENGRSIDVWCPETENGTWVMMQETDGHGVISITGNSGALVKCRKKGAKNWGKKIEHQELDENTFKLEKERGLRGWFDRNKGKGWIDCKASKKGHLVPCGRKKTGKGSERAYPACRPTLSACNKSKHKKKSSKPISWKKKLKEAFFERNLGTIGTAALALASLFPSIGQAADHHFSRSALVHAGKSDKQLQSDEYYINSWTMIKEKITNQMNSKGYIKNFYIEIIKEEHNGQKRIVVDINAKVEAESKEQAKRMLIYEIMRESGKAGLQGEAIKGLKQILMHTENTKQIFDISIKLSINPKTGSYLAI